MSLRSVVARALRTAHHDSGTPSARASHHGSDEVVPPPIEEAPRLLRYCVVEGADAGAAAELRQRLIARGFELLDQADAPSVLTVVVLPDGAADPPDGSLAASGTPPDLPHDLGHRALPVVFGSKSSRLMPDRSQLIRPVEAVDDVAARIDRLVKVGGNDLIALNEFRAAAHRWDEGGRSDNDLLPAGERADGPRLATLSEQSGGADRRLLEDFALAGVVYERRASQRRRRITGVACVALALVTTTAAIGGVAARRSAAEARAQAATALSNRLSGTAQGMLDEVPDPDLPWLLAGEALGADPTPDAQRIARLVASRIPAHVTFGLSGRAVTMAGSSNGLLVVSYRDGRAELLDATGGTLRAFDTGLAVTRVALSPAGTQLALVTPGRLVVNRASGTRFPADHDQFVTVDEEVLSARWLGSTLLALSPTKLMELRGSSPRRLANIPTSNLGTLAGLDVTADGKYLAVWGSKGMWFGTPTGKELHSSTRNDLLGVVVQADGQALHIINKRGGISVLAPRDATRPAESWSESSGAEGAFDLVRANRTTFAVLAESVCPIKPLSSSHDGCVKVGTRGLVGIAWLGQHGFATISADNRLRLWQHLGPGTKGEPYPTHISLALMNEAQSSRRAGRSQIETNTDGRLWAASGTGGEIEHATTHLTDYTDRFLCLTEVCSRVLGPGGHYFAVATSDTGAVSVYTAESNPHLVWRARKPSTATAALAALSPDGSQFVVVDGSVHLFTRSGERTFNGLSAHPVGVVFGQPGGPVVYYDSGEAVALGEGSPAKPPSKVQAVAALGANRLAWVGVDQRLSESSDGTTRTIATLPGGSEVVGLRYSPDGKRIAVFTPRQADVLDVSDGRLLYASTASTENETVQDLAFIDKNIITIDHVGRLATASLVADYAPTFLSELPRNLAPEERALFAIPAEE